MGGKRLIKFLPIALLSLVLIIPQEVVFPFTWYVATRGNDSNDCLTYSTPCRTIQAAINKANSGDYISVDAGIYTTATQTFPINITKSLDIFGKNSSTTIIDAAGSGQSVFHAAGCSYDIDIYQFAIKGGDKAIEFLGNNLNCIEGDIVLNKITSNSIGIYTQNTYLYLTANDISANTAYGIYNDDNSANHMDRNILGWNGSGGSSAAVFNDHSNNWFFNNVIGWNNGSGIENHNSSPIITNNTISFNYGGSGIANFENSDPVIKNNIITQNGVYGIHQDDTSSPTKTYNDVWGNTWDNYFPAGGGTGSISSDPLFISAFDAHLRCLSPAINAGNNVGSPSRDFDLIQRPVGAAVDMGAYERQYDIFCIACLPLIIR